MVVGWDYGNMFGWFAWDCVIPGDRISCVYFYDDNEYYLMTNVITNGMIYLIFLKLLSNAWPR